MFAAISIFFSVLIVFLIIFSVGIGIAWLMAQLLMWIFPLSLFEAMLLSTIFSAGAGYLVYRLFTAVVEEEDEILSVTPHKQSDRIRTTRIPEGIETDDEYELIPSKQFYKKASERTWEKWLTEEIANDIYAEFQDSPHMVSNLNRSQTEALAIRLAEIGIQIITSKTTRARNLKTTKSAFTKEVEKAGQKPESDEILGLAVDAYNLNMDYYNDELLNVIRDKKWNKLSTIKEQ